MITDTERLDWLEENQETVYQIVRLEITGRTDGTDNYDTNEIHCGWSLRRRTDECRTVRDAIDAGINDVEGSIFDPVD